MLISQLADFSTCLELLQVRSMDILHNQKTGAGGKGEGQIR